MKRLSLCADDYGQHPAINDGILDLAARGRLTAASCLVDGPAWRQDAHALAAIDGIEIGLHLNFTHALGAATPIWPLGGLMLRSWTGLLPRAAVADSIRRQWDAFNDALGRDPDFIDGHQHVHQFPGIREPLLDAMTARGFHGWVRSLARVTPGDARSLKPRLLPWLGGHTLAKRLRAAGLTANTDFSGIYDFNPDADYAGLMRSWLHACPDRALLMCHPARGDAGDSIAVAREREFAYLMSSEFGDDCRAAGVRLHPRHGEPAND